jgi:hypothetical protein
MLNSSSISSLVSSISLKSIKLNYSSEQVLPIIVSPDDIICSTLSKWEITYNMISNSNASASASASTSSSLLQSGDSAYVL